LDIEVSADKAYGRVLTYDFPRQHAIRAYIPFHSEHLGEGQLSRWDFIYDRKQDRYRCPQDHYLYPYEKLDHCLIKRYRLLGGYYRQCPIRLSCLPENIATAPALCSAVPDVTDNARMHHNAFTMSLMRLSS